MPDEPVDPAASPEEPGDLTARLMQLEERLSTEEPARRRRTPVRPTAPLELPELDDERLVGAPAGAAVEEPVEEDGAADAPVSEPDVAEAPVKKAPAKKTAAKRAPAKKAPAKKAPVKRPTLAQSTPASTPWPVRAAAPAPPPAAVPRPAAVPPPPPARPAAEAPVAPVRQRDGVVRLLVTLAVLLLAVAAALGAAALVEHRDATYQSRTAVRLDPGPDPTLPIAETVQAGLTKYADLAGSSAFALDAARRAGIPASSLKGDLAAAPSGTDTVELTVQASSASRARALATGAGDALVEAVNLQEAADQASAGDRLAAAVVGTPSAVVKTAPSSRDAWVAALLAAGAVLVVAGLAAVLRLTRRS